MEVEQTNFVTHLIITVQLFIIYSFCLENGVMMIPKRRLLYLIKFLKRPGVMIETIRMLIRLMKIFYKYQ